MDKPGQPVAGSTIAAIATGPGGAIAVVRVSGAEAVAVTGRVCRLGPALAIAPPRVLKLTDVCDETGEVIDQALVVRFAADGSYTGEPMVEIHCHGGRLVVRRVLARLLACGARLAEPGEFTRRAFLNGKLDLTQAEAVADVIAAGSSLALRMAEGQLHGALGRRISELYAWIGHALAEVEAHLDFPDERLDLCSGAQAAESIGQIATAVAELLRDQQRGMLLRHGVRVVIAGPPNVGKSSLLNALLGRDRAIVTPIPGTTRDTLEESIDLNGIPVCLIDTAGIRESPDPIEQDGVERARRAIATADVVLWVTESGRPASGDLPLEVAAARVVLRVRNKCDLAGPGSESAPEETGVSALTGAGLEALCNRIVQSVWGSEPRATEVCVNERHASLLQQAAVDLTDARREAEADRWELAAVPLRAALLAVGKISGKTHTPDILDKIFSRFCIGK